jgi:DNA polymerase V
LCRRQGGADMKTALNWVCGEPYLQIVIPLWNELTMPHHAQRGMALAPVTADSCRLIAAALRCVEAAWREGRGCRYAKAGVLLADLCPASAAPLDVFAAASPRRAALMAVMDRLNAKYGRDTLFPAAAGVERRWETRAARRSPRYTTRLSELPRVRA